MIFPNFSRLATHEAILYTTLITVITFCFTCDEKKIWSDIKKSEIIKIIIVDIKDHVTCGKLNYNRNTLNCQDIMALMLHSIILLLKLREGDLTPSALSPLEKRYF